MTIRALPPSEWTRLANTGCRVDKAWRHRADHGFVMSVEQGENIIATALVFKTVEGENRVDGLWIDERFRKHVSVLRRLRYAIKVAFERLGGSQVIPTEACSGWMRERSAHGVRL